MIAWIVAPYLFLKSIDYIAKPIPHVSLLPGVLYRSVPGACMPRVSLQDSLYIYERVPCGTFPSFLVCASPSLGENKDSRVPIRLSVDRLYSGCGWCLDCITAEQTADINVKWANNGDSQVSGAQIGPPDNSWDNLLHTLVDIWSFTCRAVSNTWSHLYSRLCHEIISSLFSCSALLLVPCSYLDLLSCDLCCLALLIIMYLHKPELQSAPREPGLAAKLRPRTSCFF